MIVYLTRVEHFSAAHRLWVDGWSEEKNMAMFGKCAHKNYHGHNYKLFVTVKGTPDPETGMVANAKHISKIVNKYIIDVLDHKNLNLDPSFIPDGKQTTSENLAYYIFHEIAPHLDACELHCIKLQETDKIFTEYYGE